MKTTIFLLIICISTVVNAQIASTDWSYQLDRFTFIKHQEHFNSVINNQIYSVLKKVVNHKELEGNSTNFLGKILTKQIENKEFRIYKDENCTQKIMEGEFQDILYDIERRDTIITFHPATFAEAEKIIISYVDQIPNDSTTYQIEQEWFFDEKKQQIYSQINKIGIEQVIDSTTLFYINNGKEYGKPNENLLTNPDVIWSKRIVILGDFKDTGIEKYVFSLEHLKKHNILYKTYVDNLFREITADSVRQMMNDVKKPDGIPSEYNKPMRRIPVLSDLQYYKIIQDIYYNAKTRTFNTRLVAIYPTYLGLSYKDYWSYGESFWIVYNNELQYQSWKDKIYHKWADFSRRNW